MNSNQRPSQVCSLWPACLFMTINTNVLAPPQPPQKNPSSTHKHKHVDSYPDILQLHKKLERTTADTCLDLSCLRTLHFRFIHVQVAIDTESFIVMYMLVFHRFRKAETGEKGRSGSNREKKRPQWHPFKSPPFFPPLMGTLDNQYARGGGYAAVCTLDLVGCP